MRRQPDQPIINTNKRTEYVPRVRVLSDAEVAAIWSACDGDFGRIIKLLLLTGCRRTEIAALRWEEVEGDLIVLPGERTKNGLAFEVPLAGMAQQVLGPKPDGTGGFVFGRRGTGFTGFSKSKRELDAKLNGVKAWTLHDLRRTAATRMGDLGVQPHVIEAALNHISGHKAGVAGIYNRAAYAAEKRQAVEIWATHLATLLAGGNVVKLRRA